LSASVGAGHLRAAQAVELALRELAPEADTRNVDVLDLTNAAFRRVYGRAYLDLIAKAPHVLGYFYDLMDVPPSPAQKSDRLRRLVEKLNLQKFLKLLGGPWDIIVNTHFLPAELTASLRRDGRIATPQFTVTTDFETHRLWANQPCDHYFTATDEGRQYLAHWGVPAEDISVTGIPIHPVFRRPKDRAACLERLQLAGDRPVVLQLAGGFGVGPVEKIHGQLLSIAKPLEIIVVAGRNAELKQRVESQPVPAHHRRTVLGFTDQMDELLAVADVVLSKPGGLTTSEILARGAALAVVNPIPGQESRNSDFLLENGAAIKINNLGTLAFKVGQLLDDPARLAAIKQNAHRLGRPEAAYDIARAALAWPARPVVSGSNS
ncbi:MAG TPA: glycosyltransferase, partial [Pirellulales bacterium]|nr:glycosyltransferase [Pirellulales bacterium]